MDDATRTMIRGWIKDYHGDHEKTARYIASVIGRSIGSARRIVAEAVKP